MHLVERLVSGCGHLQHLLELFGCEVVIEEVDGVEMFSVLFYLIVNVRAGGFACITHPSDDFAPFDVGARPHLDPVHVPIECLVTEAVVDDHVVPVAVPQISCGRHATIGSGKNWGALWGGEIESGVEFHGLVYRVDPLSEAGGDAFEVPVVNRLDRRGRRQEFFLILDHAFDLHIGFLLVSHPADNIG